jgi:acyl carrier protein
MEIESQVRAFLQKAFRANVAGLVLTVDTPLFSTGVVDSFGVLELISFLEETFGIEIDTGRHDLLEFDTIASITSLVAALHGPRG